MVAVDFVFVQACAEGEVMLKFTCFKTMLVLALDTEEVVFAVVRFDFETTQRCSLLYSGVGFDELSGIISVDLVYLVPVACECAVIECGAEATVSVEFNKVTQMAAEVLGLDVVEGASCVAVVWVIFDVRIGEA